MDKSLVKDIVAKSPPKKNRPADYGVTIKEYARSEGISEDQSKRTLNALVDAGFLVCREDMVWRGKASKIFIRADKAKSGK